MELRSLTLFGLLVGTVTLVSAGCSWAQQQGDAAAKANADGSGAQSVDDDLFATVDDDEPTTAESAGADAEGEAQPPAVDGPDLTNAMAADAKVLDLTERVVALQTEVEELKATIVALQQSLARVQDPAEFSRQTLGAMAEDVDLRSNLGQMLQGKVRLLNNTGESQIVYINGTPWTVVDGESFVYSPVGTVSFLHEEDNEPIFKGIQEWTENQSTGQFELEYRIGVADTPTEASVLMKVPARTQ